MKKPSFFKLSITMLLSLAILSCSKDDDSETNSAPVVKAQNFNASESIGDTDVIGKVVATDAEGDKLSFSIKTNSNNLFEINTDGEISLQSGKLLDYETAISHDLKVAVSDGKLSSEASVKITVIDVDENAAPVFMAQSFTVPEDLPLGDLVGELIATDPDGDNIIFSWAPNQNVTVFQLDNNSIRTVSSNSQGELDYEVDNLYTVFVIASDGQLQTQAEITINVSDVNDPVVISPQTFTVAEDIDETDVIGQIVATDQDGDALTFGIELDYDLLFKVSPSGEITLRDGRNLDFETSTSHQLDINVTDGTVTRIVDITIDVTDVVEPSTIATIADTDSPGNAPSWGAITAITEDSAGNIYVSDETNRSIRKIDANGMVSTLLNSSGAKINVAAVGLAIDSNDDLYISDYPSNRILKYEMSSKTLTVFAGTGNAGNDDGSLTTATFNGPAGLDFDASGNLYVADRNNNIIRKIDDNGVTTFAGSKVNSGYRNGQGSNAYFNTPYDVVTDSNGNVYVAEDGNHSIRFIDTAGNVVSHAGSISGMSGNIDNNNIDARFDRPLYIDIDEDNNLYVGDYNNHAIRKVSPNGTVTSVINNPPGDVIGDVSNARLRNARGVHVRSNGDLLVTDANNFKLKVIRF